MGSGFGLIMKTELYYFRCSEKTRGHASGQEASPDGSRRMEDMRTNRIHMLRGRGGEVHNGKFAQHALNKLGRNGSMTWPASLMYVPARHDAERLLRVMLI